ncbi:MAG: pyridoxal phosphate-dependent aminotransferase [Bacillota bacterium]
MISISHNTSRIPGSGIRKIFDAATGITGVIHLEVGDPDFRTPSHIIEAAHRAAMRGDTHYAPSAGKPRLREAIAAKLMSENGIKCEPSQIIVTVGAVGAVASALLSVLDPGDEVMVTDPYWPNYLGLTTMAGGKLVPIKLHEELGFAPDLDEIQDKITSRTKVLILNSPNNPTGGVLPEDLLMKIGEIALRHRMLVISDEVYEKIVFDGTRHFSLGSVPEFRDNVLTVNGMSKTFAMTGWRIGYACGPQNVIDAMAKIYQISVSSVSSVIQEAALAALTGPQEPVLEMVRAYQRRRDLVVAGLESIPGITCVKPKGAFYVMPNISSYGMTSLDFSLALLNRGKVATVPGSALGQNGEGYIRISCATSEDNLKEALGRMKDFVTTLSK